MRPRFAVSWNEIPINELVKSLPQSGKWSANKIFYQAETVHYWNRRPSEFGLCEPEEDIHFMHAYKVTKDNIDRWEAKLSKDQAFQDSLKVQ